ncbi:DegT/DnrJ/EryC1/StrS family aminotransferase [Microcoleus sp. ARI1-B5]|uniref:DegT/DnrJ/EryC1/StrS family aminotransferase n=1 Tax=unclassified Microcoleus TaxID=2642155 RepID=UPI002FD0873E
MVNETVIFQSNPKANYQAHKAEIDAAIHRVLDSGWYILGREVEAFEQEFAAYISASHCIGVANGTDALEIALRACGIGSGDAVITVSHTAVATVAAIELTGATPVLVDVDPVTFTMDANYLEEAIAQTRQNSSLGNLKAIIPVHLYGHPADMPAIVEIARRHELYVIEDCAQSHGATIEGRKTGIWGDLGTFSFYPTKNLGALGDGGAVVTNHAPLAEKVRSLQQYGWRERYISDIPGMNTRLDELQAAILRVKLAHLDEENYRRQQVANHIYDTLLFNTPLKRPQKSGNIDHVYHQYVVRDKERDDLRAFLKDNSIGTLIHYPLPVHLQPAYQGRVAVAGMGLEVTEQIGREILSLPMYPQLSDEQVQQVSKKITVWYQKIAEKA